MARDTIAARFAAAALALGTLALAACGGATPDAQAGQETAALAATPAADADAAASAADAAQESPLVVVHKSPTCGCCAKWVDHMREAGFRIEVHDMADVTPVKTQHGVPAALRSCHTAVVGDYVFEGHVPAEIIRRFLAEKPAFAGLAVPGMPMGAPGMEGPRQDRYDVVAFRRDGETEVYSSH